MQIEGIKRELGSEPARARRVLRDIQDMVRVEQRRVRNFVEDARPQRLPLAIHGEVSLAAVLHEVVEQERKRWGLDLIAEVVPTAATVPELLARDVHSMLREACANAVRHGNARRVEIACRAQRDRLHCSAQDDGHGFAFAGRLEGEALLASCNAPRMILERVTALGGTLALESTPRGARLDIEVPLHTGRS